MIDLGVCSGKETYRSHSLPMRLIEHFLLESKAPARGRHTA